MSKRPTKQRQFSDILVREVKPPLNTLPKKKKPRPSFFRRLLEKELHKHPFAVPVITISVLSVMTLVGLIFFNGREVGLNDSHVVQLSINGERTVLPTRALTVGDFLARAKVQIKQGDVVEPEASTRIEADDFRINVYRAKKVLLVDNGKRIEILSAASTPRAIAAQGGIRVYAEDKIVLTDPQEVLRNNLLEPELVIERATPVNLNLYGEQVTVRTHVKTVRELLKEKNVVLAAKDQVIPAVDTKLDSNLQVFITRVGVKIETEKEKIPNKEEVVDDSSLSFGTVAQRQAGSPGSKLVTYEVKLENGVEVSRKKIQEVIIKDPVTRIVARGRAVSIPANKTAWMSAAGIAESDYPYVNFILSREAGWCPTKWQGQIGYCPPYYEQLHSESSGFGYGLCQSTPAIKMASAGDDWRTNAVTQLKWCHGYAVGRYGSWEAAYNFWSNNHWW